MTYAVPFPQTRHLSRPASRRMVYDVHEVPRDEQEFIYANFRTPLVVTFRRLSEMLSWEENWDGSGAAQPNVFSILKAKRWISQMRKDATQTQLGWVEPHTIADENGDVVFEWWNKGRNLIVYVSLESTEYLQVWGPDIESEMADGETSGPEDNKELWRWLME